MKNSYDNMPDKTRESPAHNAAQPRKNRGLGDGSAYFAALDLGTNNCRLMIGERGSVGVRVVDSFNRSVRLGEGLQSSGALSEEAMVRAINALHVCAARIRHWPVQAIRGVATEACRRAVNGKEFLSRVHRETGIILDLISPREEAELAMESCGVLLHANNHRRSRGLLFDIGGGSTEIAWLRLDPTRRAQDLSGTVSIPCGVITIAESFRPPAPGADAAEHEHYYESMVRHVIAQLSGFEDVHQIRREIQRRNVAMLGTSGTITTLAGVALGLPRYNRQAVDGVTLTDTAALEAIDILRDLEAAEEPPHPCIGIDRSTYVLPGCAIFEAIHRLWPVDNIIVADRGLRDGLLARMARDGDAMRRSRPRPSRDGYPSARIVAH
ncbi:Ppx/GppA phosphatase family protein [Brytella acorum]|uniref:Ppx/GppA phosphatase family protein n=1 Tax=Brytella acorum TaxID=2959299 RepID=A0AA35UWE9_9PROT|nr:Ppx/GppA phosphatase family protein [Brytella acorum]MDF3623973.1 Ppx/GppA phosphatase family protein [Brytella acorum]CAI9120924.1 Ppx/GppA phosphatase family protein [Brytella acorum]